MRMLKVSPIYLAAALAIVVSLSSFQSAADALTFTERAFFRRQTQSDGPEQEGTTQPTNKEANKNNNNNNNNNDQQGQLPPRLYPDLPRAPVGVFGQPPEHHYPPNVGPTPFNPFGRQLQPARESMQPMPRPMSPAERLQSQTFTSGLGRRLLSMVGIEAAPSSNETDPDTARDSRPPNSSAAPMEETMKALQNSTVLQQLNKGVQSIYGNLSKMYNSTVQQQLDMLQERFKKQSENSTNTWQQRMAQQVPQFFKAMAGRVNEAQEGLNRMWEQVGQVSSGNASLLSAQSGQQSRSLLNPFEHFMGGQDGYANEPILGQHGNFFHQIGRSLGFNNDDPTMGLDRQDNGSQANGVNTDMASQMRAFWMNQVQPQIGMLRGQIGRVWRDLTNSGVLATEPIIMSRNGNNNNNFANKPDKETTGGSSEIVDSILKEVDMTGGEYALVEPKADQQQPADGRSGLGMQMTNRLIAMQRDLNQLWSGLSNSLQNALGNVRNVMNPQPRFGPLESASNKRQEEADPQENEIEGTIRDLSKLQKEADVVHDVVQRQQQTQQRQALGDRFRTFLNDVDFNMDQLPDRIGNSVSRFGNAVSDFWHQIPRRWDNFRQNMRQDQPMRVNARIEAANDTRKPDATSGSMIR